MIERPQTVKYSPDQGFSTLRDQKLLAKALQQRWPISDTMRTTVIGSLEKILDGPQESLEQVEIKLAAIRNIAILDKLNVDLIKAFIPKQIIHTKATDLTDEELDQAIVEEAQRITDQRSVEQAKTLEFSIVGENNA